MKTGGIMVRQPVRCILFGLLCFGGVLVAETSESDEAVAPGITVGEPTSNYEPRSVQGWKVLVNRRLLEQTNLCQAALRVVDHQLDETARRIPPAAVARLRKVTIWLDLTNRGTRGGVYHPSAEWLKGHGYNPDMARCVSFGVARNVVEWSRWQPFMVLHELAHAWHHQVVGYDDKALLEAYRRALASKTYENVLQIQGKSGRHYGMNNVQEYFAECSEAYFGVNDFYPFVRPELKAHDPEGFKAVEEAWKKEPK